jgi:cytidine deaminase
VSACNYGLPVPNVDLELIEVAQELIDLRGDGAYHTVAGAARSGGGGIVTGVNVYHFTGGPCAELVVVGRAVAEGDADLRQIVAVGDRGRGVLPPCGRCRQLLFDFFTEIDVIIGNGDALRTVKIGELLPFLYRWDKETGSAAPG